MGTTLALFAGYGGYKISNMTHSSDRYPTKTEFSIINYCINGDDTLQYKKNLEEKRNICINAYNKTIQQISYNDFKQDQKKFITVFSENINQ